MFLLPLEVSVGVFNYWMATVEFFQDIDEGGDSGIETCREFLTFVVFETGVHVARHPNFTNLHLTVRTIRFTSNGAHQLFSKAYFVYFLAKLVRPVKCSLDHHRQVRSCRIVSCALVALQPSKLVLILLACAVLMAPNKSSRVPQHTRSPPVRDTRRWDQDNLIWALTKKSDNWLGRA